MAPINPLAVTDYDRTQADLERFWLFGILVAGKNADWAAHKVGSLLKVPDVLGVTPFTYFRTMPGAEVALHNLLVANRIGQYSRIKRAIADSLALDLRTASVAELCSVFGVGPKTARFFVLHTRPGAQVAVLDTHILRWLRESHGCDVPKTTPSEPAYSRIEHVALGFMRDTFPGLTPAQADLLIWSVQSGRLDGYEFTGLPSIPANDTVADARD